MKVLLGGHINLNVLDGSAFFMTSIARLMSAHEGVTVDLVSSLPIEDDRVTSELLDYHGVTVVDPYQPGGFREDSDIQASSGISPEGSAEVIAEALNSSHYDVAFVRGTEVGLLLAERSDVDSNRLIVYVTGLTHFDEPRDELLERAVAKLANLSSYLVFKTPETLGGSQCSIWE